MLKVEALPQFFTDNGAPPTTEYAYNHTPMSPDALITITSTPGIPTEAAEGDLEIAGVQLRSRSARNQAGAERDLLHQLDSIIMNESLYPFSLGGFRVLSGGRHGGPPTFMKVDQQHRSTHVCNYLFLIQR